MVPATKDYQRRTFRPQHRPVARAIAEAFFSHDGELDDERLDAFVDRLDRFVSAASKTLRFGLLVMLTVIRWSPLLFGRLRAFDELSREERVRHLERLERSKVPQLPLLVVSYKTVMTLLFYDDPSEQSAIGYTDDRERYKRGLPVAVAPYPRVT